MTLLGLLILLAVAALCGSIGAGLAGASSHGCLSNIAIGFIGALIGTWLSRELLIGDFIYFSKIPIVWSIIGSAIFVAIMGVLSNSSSRKK